MPLGKRTDFGDAKFAGAEVEYPADLVETLQGILICGFDFMAVPLTNPHKRRSPPRPSPTGIPAPPFARSDLLLNSAQWSGQIVGTISPWIQPDADDPELVRDSEAALRQELEWAAHLSLQACMLTLPHGLRNANYARILNQVANGLSNMTLWLRIPMLSIAHQAASEAEGTLSEGSDVHTQPNGVSVSGRREDDSWEWWNQVRCLCGHQPKLGLALELPESLPSRAHIQRWLGEPVKVIVVPTSIFVTNKRGYPTLTRPHQEVLALFMSHNVQVILSGDAKHQAPESAEAASNGEVAVAQPEGASLHFAGETHPLRIYWDYLSYLFRKQQGPSEQEQLELGYRDYLQAPLQPLQDNLESQTYETFEKDAAKYIAYENAVHAALLDRVPEPEASTRETLLMVVGAGRGPLVRASLQAAARAGRKLRVYAVEKNPNAVVTLQNLVVSEGWGEAVTIISADMRSWQAPEQADILVSELLGSFGDNELSPECLDGAQRFLKEDGISIPYAYTSYMQPITSTKLWNDVKAYNDLEHFETPYVAKLYRFTPLAPTQAVHMWRCGAHHKVWYEWGLTAPAVTPIHNPCGRSYYVGL
ncbi:hypothetical protein WJX72_007776 [[Myrmecia] bisecta]|uniref:Protein arginine N-methyltransferase n=1 Tax=[Myrmecia] bisecta TaxID=41462 RepID=A0AAW1QG73_9CHLO